MVMTNMTEIMPYYRIVWEDFIVKDTDAVTSEVDINNVAMSEKAKLAALNFSKYKGYANTAYGESIVDKGITEQQAYDIWNLEIQKQQRIYIKRLKELKINTLPQSVFDGLFLYHWATMKDTTVESLEGIYDFRNALISKDYNTVASMIARSYKNKPKCILAATIMRLADYGKNKSRSQLRTEGLFNIRSANELGMLNDEELNRARFTYFAETLKFLPNTPEGIKRNIAKQYESTITTYRFVYDGSTTNFDINTEPSLSPVEKLEITVNDTPIQHLFDYTLNGTIVNINKVLSVNDIIIMKIKI
jgi:hypothetical protein